MIIIRWKIHKRVGLAIVCSLFFLQVIGIKVVFEKQTILKEDAVKGLPEYIRERALKWSRITSKNRLWLFRERSLLWNYSTREEVSKITKVDAKKQGAICQ
jgi:hypothetical protein